MELSNIQQFLEVYRKKLFAEEDDRKSVLETINTVCGIALVESDVVINKGVITVKTDTTTRNHLFLYKTKILEQLKTRSKKPIFDIR